MRPFSKIQNGGEAVLKEASRPIDARTKLHFGTWGGARSVTKNDMVIEIAKKTNVEQQKVKQIVQLTLDSIVEILTSEKRIELRNFGVFEVRTRKARKARNPRTGAEVMVPSKQVVTFKAGKIMEERIENTKGADSSAVAPAAQGAPATSTSTSTSPVVS
jgi:nucleoid DNA-binding protein